MLVIRLTRTALHESARHSPYRLDIARIESEQRDLARSITHIPQKTPMYRDASGHMRYDAPRMPPPR